MTQEEAPGRAGVPSWRLGPDHLVPDWWAWVDSNYRPHAYQARALTN